MEYRIKLTKDEKEGLIAGELLSGVGNLFFLIEETDKEKKESIIKRMAELHDPTSAMTVLEFCQWLFQHQIPFTIRCRYLKQIGLLLNIRFFMEYQLIKREIDHRIGKGHCF